jgi:hypothetical protein
MQALIQYSLCLQRRGCCQHAVTYGSAGRSKSLGMSLAGVRLGREGPNSGHTPLRCYKNWVMIRNEFGFGKASGTTHDGNLERGPWVIFCKRRGRCWQRQVGAMDEGIEWWIEYTVTQQGSGPGEAYEWVGGIVVEVWPLRLRASVAAYIGPRRSI